MMKNKGFTLIELMVVILIVAILAAVLAPMMTGRIEEAKWSEGKAAAGTIASAIRAFAAENEGLTTDAGQTLSNGSDFSVIGITAGDLEGKYFEADCYSVGNLAYDATAVPPVTYTISINGGNGKGGAPSGTYTLDQTGAWTKTAAPTP